MANKQPVGILKQFTWAMALLLVLWGAYVVFSAPLARLYCSWSGGAAGAQGNPDAVMRAGSVLWAWDGRFVLFSGVLLGLMLAGLAAMVLAGAPGKRKNVQSKAGASKQAKTELSAAKKIVFGAMCFLLVFSLMAGVLVFRHSIFLNKIHARQTKGMAAPDYEPPVFPGVDERDLLNLGWAHTEKNHPVSSYVNFSKEKGKGRVRIGIFGCSFVQGMEAASGHDIASFTRELFLAAGMTNVEVINFGVFGYGMHQSHMLWENLGSHYGLDFVVFFPYPFHEQRDRTFQSDSDIFGGIHARYILKEGRLEKIPVVGTDKKEICERYYSFFPPWRYCRYDEKPPGFLRSLGNGGGRNPLYYRLYREREEVLRTWQLLFQDIARRSQHLLVMTGVYDTPLLAGGMELSNVTFLHSQLPKFTDLYQAPFGHDSAIGNRLKAQVVFNCLSGMINPGQVAGKGFSFARLKPAPAGTAGRKIVQPLSRWEKVALSVGGRSIGSFISRDEGWKRFLFDFKARGCKSLLLLYRSGGVRFLALPFVLEDGADITLNCTVKGKVVSLRLGRVESSGGVIGRIIPRKGRDGERCNADTSGLSATLYMDPLRVTGIALGQVENIEVLLGKYSLFRGVQSAKSRYLNRLTRLLVPRAERVEAFDVVALQPHPYLVLCSVAGQYVPPESLKGDTARLDLLLRDEQGAAEAVPSLLEWAVEDLSRKPQASTAHSRH